MPASFVCIFTFYRFAPIIWRIFTRLKKGNKMSKKVQQKTNLFANSSILLGLLSLFEEYVGIINLSLAAIIIGGVMSAAALIFGMIGFEFVKAKQLNGKGQAIAGIVIGGVGLIVLLFYFFIWVPKYKK
jgi:hypothetical protein